MNQKHVSLSSKFEFDLVSLSLPPFDSAFFFSFFIALSVGNG